MRTLRFGLLALSLTMACGGGSSQQPGSVQPASAQTQSRNPDVLTRAELLQSAQSTKDLFEAIRSLRPNFINPLTTRTQGAEGRTLPRPVVYVDGSFAGELDVLRSILVNNVAEVRFKSPTAAAVELGNNAPGGAIMVMMHKEAKP